MLQLLLIFWLTFACGDKVSRGPLFDYVYRPDDTYEWSEIGEYKGEGVTTYIINMTSQTWKSEISDHHTWWHFLTIHVPDELDYTDSAFMYISGGRMSDTPPTPTSTDHIRKTLKNANETNMVTAVLRQIPNQPIEFYGDDGQRSEDSLIAWTWNMCVNDSASDPEILLRMPMTKAAVKAMDTITDFVKSKREETNIQKFMVAGESKRGWTTWTTGAMDDRVVAMAPVVLSCLNFNENMHHHYRALGGWTFALLDYYLEGLSALIDDPRAIKCLDIVDPISFAEYMTMPKLVVSAASDEFFMPDDSHYFWDQLQGQKYIWLLENTGHSIGRSPLNTEYWEALQTFFIGVLDNYEFPELSWQREESETGGSITLTSSKSPAEVSAWSAHSVGTERRDFRLNVGIPPSNSNITWHQGEVEDLGSNMFRAVYDKPEDGGFLAFFIKVKFDGPKDRDLYFTSEVHVIPDTFPFEDCEGLDCFGDLV